MTPHRYLWTTALPPGVRFFPPLLEELEYSMNEAFCSSAETLPWPKVLLLIWHKFLESPFLEKLTSLVTIVHQLKKKKLKIMMNLSSRWTFEFAKKSFHFYFPWPLLMLFWPVIQAGIFRGHFLPNSLCVCKCPLPPLQTCRLTCVLVARRKWSWNRKALSSSSILGIELVALKQQQHVSLPLPRKLFWKIWKIQKKSHKNPKKKKKGRKAEIKHMWYIWPNQFSKMEKCNNS